jgi:hypothetical protein
VTRRHRWAVALMLMATTLETVAAIVTPFPVFRLVYTICAVGFAFVLGCSLTHWRLLDGRVAENSRDAVDTARHSPDV